MIKILRYAFLVGLISSPFCQGLSLSPLKHIGSGVVKSGLSLGCMFLVYKTLTIEEMTDIGAKNHFNLVYERASDNRWIRTWLARAADVVGNPHEVQDFFANASFVVGSVYGAYRFGSSALGSFKQARREITNKKAVVENKLDDGASQEGN